jgi:hypothetical protein
MLSVLSHNAKSTHEAAEKSNLKRIRNFLERYDVLEEVQMRKTISFIDSKRLLEKPMNGNHLDT